MTANQSQPTFTSGQVAQIIGVPHATLRTWQQRGLLDFIRDITEIDEGDERVAPIDEDGFARWRWSRFTETEVHEIALIKTLVEGGLGHSLAAVFAERSRAAILLERHRYICVARVGEIYCALHGSLDTFGRPNNWFLKGKGWLGEWFTREGTPTNNTIKPAVPALPGCFTIVDLFHVRERTQEAIEAMGTA